MAASPLFPPAPFAPPFSPGRPPPPPAPPSPPLPENLQEYTSSGCAVGDVTCINNHLSDNQIYTALYISAALGAICLLAFGALRGRAAIYMTRLHLPEVWHKPAKPPTGGIQQLWTWLIPVICATEAEILSSSGLDTLMFMRVPLLGIQLFFPLTILGCITLIPTFWTDDKLASTILKGGNQVPSTSFMRLTMANVNNGSARYLVPFFYVYFVVLYTCWVLDRHYRSYVLLRQRYLLSGEVFTKTFEDYLLEGARKRTSDGSATMQDDSVGGKAQGKPAGGVLQAIAGVFSLQEMDKIEEGLEDDETEVGPATAHVSQLRKSSSTRQQSETGLRRRTSHTSQSSSCTAAPHRPVSMSESGAVGGHTTTAQPMRSDPAPDETAMPSDVRIWVSRLGSGAAGDSVGSGSGRPWSLTSASAASATSSTIGPHKPTGSPNKRSSWPQPAPHNGAIAEQPSAEAPQAVPQALEKISMASQATSQGAARPRQQALLHAPARQQWMSRMDSSARSVASAQSADSGVVTKWWQERTTGGDAEAPEDSAAPQMLLAKPPVQFRKIVNTRGSDGELVGVTAQQYVVLVMDVPGPQQRQRKRSWLPRVKSGWQTATLTRGLMQKLSPSHHTKDMSPDVVEASLDTTNDAELDMADPAAAPEPTDAAASHDQASSGLPTTANGGASPVVNAASPADSAAHRSVPVPGQYTPAAASGRQELQASTECIPPGGSDATNSADEQRLADRQQLVTETFRRLFPDSFQQTLPILMHKEVDLLLMEWDSASKQLELAQVLYERSGNKTRPTTKPHCCGTCGKGRDDLEHFTGRVAELEVQIAEAQQRVLESNPTPSFFVFFNSQKDAAIAAQTNLHPEDGHSFRVIEAPGPEEVNWPTVWLSWKQREVHELLTLPFIIIIMLIPISLFTGAIAQANIALCGGNSSFNSIRWDWYCQQGNALQVIVTSVVAPLLLMLWQSIVMPNALYYFSSSERQSESLSKMDRRVGLLFFYWDIFNVFLGGMLGGSIFSQLGVLIHDPTKVQQIIGSAMPSSSSFFINYIIWQAFAMLPFRFLYPHAGALPELFRLFGCCQPVTERQKVDVLWSHSIRYGREIGNLMLVFVIAFSYCAVAPIILPFALVYFVMAWLFWRYQILYVNERCFESGGRVWDNVVSMILACLFLLEFFTGCVMLVDGAYAEGSILIFTLTPFLYKVHTFLQLRYGNAVQHMPLETAAAAPLATIDPAIYTPPALHAGAAGWHPNIGKAWEGWGAPTYTL